MSAPELPNNGLPVRVSADGSDVGLGQPDGRTPPPGGRRPIPALTPGSLLSAIIVGLCAYVMVSWPAGWSGDLLLGAAALGLLLRLPHTIAIWAGLTTLVATAVALTFNDQDLASRCADLAYYGIAVGCLWALWDLALERLRWPLPVPLLYRRLADRHRPLAAAAPLAAASEREEAARA